jgi:hypothetical protein
MHSIQTVEEQPENKRVVSRRKLGKRERADYLYPRSQSKQWKEPCGVQVCLYNHPLLLCPEQREHPYS